jgi:hypothetical protein
MNKEQIIDEAYKNYLINFIRPICPPNLDVQPSYYEPMTKEWFIKSIKERSLRGNEFSQKWGLKIEERELSISERGELFRKTYPGKSVDDFAPTGMEVQSIRHQLDTRYENANIPTKLITLTYNNETIESYE